MKNEKKSIKLTSWFEFSIRIHVPPVRLWYNVGTFIVHIAERIVFCENIDSLYTVALRH